MAIQDNWELDGIHATGNRLKYLTTIWKRIEINADKFPYKYWVTSNGSNHNAPSDKID